MASFTMFLKTAVKYGGTDPGFNEILAALEAYPIFDEDHRADLNQRILDHYWLREIGHETVSVFAFQLGKKLREVMPLYNQLYKTELLKFDPLSTFDLSTTRDDNGRSTGNRASKNGATNTAGSESRSVSSDFPQTELSDNAAYATSGVDAGSNSKSTAASSSSDTSDDSTESHGTSRTTGYQGAAADLLTKFRATILNIDMMVVGELDECFLGVFDIGHHAPAPYAPLALYGRL